MYFVHNLSFMWLTVRCDLSGQFVGTASLSFVGRGTYRGGEISVFPTVAVRP